MRFNDGIFWIIKVGLDLIQLGIDTGESPVPKGDR